MKRPNEYRTGLLVLGGFAIFIFANIIIRGISFSQEGYTVFVDFPRVSGINPGSDVRLADGIKIGKVVAIEMKAGNAIVETRIRRDVKLTSGSRGTITSTTFLSELFLSISPGTGLGRTLAGGETITGVAPMSMVDGIREFGTLMKNLNTLISTGGENGGGIVKDLSAVIQSIAGKIEQMLEAGSRDVGTTFRNLAEASRKLNTLLDEFAGSGTKIQRIADTVNADLPTMLANLRTTSDALARLSAQATTGRNSVAALFSDRKFYDDINFILENLKQMTFKLKNDPSILIWRDGR